MTLLPPSFNGKTIARVEREPVDPEYLSEQSDTMLLHFTDGTALRVVGSSYEEVDLRDELIDAEEVETYAEARRQLCLKRAEAERERVAWLALSCEERTAAIDAREKAMSPGARAMKSVFAGAISDMLREQNRQFFWGEQGIPAYTRTDPCEACGERECENAVQTFVPAKPAVPNRPGVVLLPRAASAQHDPPAEQ